MICDRSSGQRDGRDHRACHHRLTGSGAVGAIGNRRALRLPPSHSTCSAATALYARERHASAGAISNLELYWNAQSRRA
jgi:thioesterase DpgC